MANCWNFGKEKKKPLSADYHTLNYRFFSRARKNQSFFTPVKSNGSDSPQPGPAGIYGVENRFRHTFGEASIKIIMSLIFEYYLRALSTHSFGMRMTGTGLVKDGLVKGGRYRLEFWYGSGEQKKPFLLSGDFYEVELRCYEKLYKPN